MAPQRSTVTTTAATKGANSGAGVKGALWLAVWLALATTAGNLISMASAKTGPTHGKVVVCYISTWAVYRPGHGAYGIDNFDPNLCTHVVYAFAGLDVTQSAIKSLDPWQDLKEDYGKGGYEHLTGLKAAYPHLKVTLAIGGWNEGSANYSTMVADPGQRGKFVKQVSGFVRKYNFDGLDLDWEYPTQRGGSPSDRENFVALTRELREEFDRHKLLLTSAIGASKTVIDVAYDVPQIAKYLDFLHIMCYDYHGSWDKKVGYNAPLRSSDLNDPLTVEYTIDYLLSMGAPPHKLVLGLPFYGRTFVTPFEGAANDGIEGNGFQGPYTREDGFLGYNEICAMLSNKTSGWQSIWDPETSQVLARSERNAFDGMVQVVTFDSSRSIANKIRFAVAKQLAGVMIWSVDTDDFQGSCAPEEDIYEDFKYLGATGQTAQPHPVLMPKRTHANYPLLRTINEAVPLARMDIQQEIAYERENRHKHKDHEQDHDHRDRPEAPKRPSLPEDRPKDEDNEIPTGTVDDRKGSSENHAAAASGGRSWAVALVVVLLGLSGLY